MTGSGKTFTMAKVIEKLQPPDAGAGAQQDAGRPALCANSRSFSPTTRWNTSSPTTITISRRRISPTRTPTLKRTLPSTTRSTGCVTRRTSALLERRDVIVVSSVSCIYGLGDPDRLPEHGDFPAAGACEDPRTSCCDKLVEIRYERNDMDFDAEQVPRPGGHGGDLSRLLDGTAPSGWSFSATRSTASARSTPLPAMSKRRAEPRGHLSRQPLRRSQGENGSAAIVEIQRGAVTSGWNSSATTTSCIEAQRIAPADACTTWKCCRRSGFCTGIENYSRVISGAGAGDAAHHAAGLFPQGLSAVYRREPRDPAPGAGHV